MRKHRITAEQQGWIELGRRSFMPGELSLEEFLKDIPKRSPLWYRMKDAFEEGRRRAIEDSPDQPNPTRQTRN
jgi:hypothetical protein